MNSKKSEWNDRVDSDDLEGNDEFIEEDQDDQSSWMNMDVATDLFTDLCEAWLERRGPAIMKSILNKMEDTKSKPKLKRNEMQITSPVSK